MKPLKVGIVVEKWKRPIFKKFLTESGYKYTEHKGITKGSVLWKVITDEPFVLKQVLEQAAAAAARSEMN